MKQVKFTHPALVYCEEVNAEEIPAKDCVDYIWVTEFKYEVCPTCQGHGVHERQDIDCSRLVDSMMEDGDMDALEAYHNGAYDVQCTKCHGKRVVLVPVLPESIQKYINEWEQAQWEYQREAAAERAVGA